METRRLGLAIVGAALVFGASGAAIPADLHVSVTDRAITFVHDGAVLSTAVICPGYRFDQFGETGPRLSPDNHWVLIDVEGPFLPGNVARTHALVDVRTGDVVLAPSFPTYFGVPTSLEPLAWASGERATLAYTGGKSATIHDPPLRSIPPPRCGGASGEATPGPENASPAPGSSPTPFPF